jgi:hypothetical protein
MSHLFRKQLCLPLSPFPFQVCHSACPEEV